MQLPIDTAYRIEVTAEGFSQYIKLHTLNAGDQILTIKLKLIPLPEKPRLSFEPIMINIPGGCFEMGSPASEVGRRADERQHSICVEDYEIGKYEVTQAQWKAIMGGNPSNIKGNQYPVEQVSWNDIQRYIHILNSKTGKNYRLPTETEWEYAARGSSRRAYPWGNIISHKQANYGKDNCCGGLVKDRDRWKYTSPVGRFSANGYGLFDTVGNVWEWTCSIYSKNYNSNVKNCASKEVDGMRVIRGGSWDSGPARVRSAGRSWFNPISRGSNIGFRLARTN